MLHFVGFKNDRVFNALKVFGQPDFWHRRWDHRALCEIAEGDTVVFADGDESSPVDPFAFDDSAVAPGKDCGDECIVEFGGVHFYLDTLAPNHQTLTPVDDPQWMLRILTNSIQGGQHAR